MEQRHLGRVGCSYPGSGCTLGWGREVDADEAKNILAGFADAGGSFVDTAGKAMATASGPSGHYGRRIGHPG
jgi:aryl-alcohol dehydrogenase-like predicted oxidoreductase